MARSLVKANRVRAARRAKPRIIGISEGSAWKEDEERLKGTAFRTITKLVIYNDGKVFIFGAPYKTKKNNIKPDQIGIICYIDSIEAATKVAKESEVSPFNLSL